MYPKSQLDGLTWEKIYLFLLVGVTKITVARCIGFSSLLQIVFYGCSNQCMTTGNDLKSVKHLHTSNEIDMLSVLLIVFFEKGQKGFAIVFKLLAIRMMHAMYYAFP